MAVKMRTVGSEMRHHHLLIVLSLWAASCGLMPGEVYHWTTIAGMPGTNGSADGINSEARFNFPSEIAIDPAGTLYVSDLSNHTIRRIVPSGTNWVVSTIAGSPLQLGFADGIGSVARFDRPQGIKVDEAGNLFVADLTQRIRKLTPIGGEWMVTSIAGTAYVRGGADGTNEQAQFFSPRGLAIEKGRRVAVADSANHIIRELTAEQTNWVVKTIAGEALYFSFEDGTNEWAAFNTPFGITVIGQDLYVADTGNNAIRKISQVGPDRVTTTVAGGAGYTGNFGSTDGPPDQALFNFPVGITADSMGNLYVTDQSNHTIRKLAYKDREVSTIGGMPLQFGTADGEGSAARFRKPWGITIDSAGNLYVVDYSNHTIRKGTPILPAGPELGIQLVPGSSSIVLSWPVASGNFLLERSDDPASSSSWTPVPESVFTVGETYFVTNSISGGVMLYRLRGQ